MSRDQLPEGAEMSARGFVHMPRVEGQDGLVVRVYESSLATMSCVWLEIREANARAVIELPLTAVVKLRDQLTWLIENHYQLGADEEPVPPPPVPFH